MKEVGMGGIDQVFEADKGRAIATDGADHVAGCCNGAAGTAGQANAHASQGATADMAIVVAQSSEGALINRSLVGALFTRTREQVTFVVDNLSSFEPRARENAGEKASALEIAGQATDRSAAGDKQSSNPRPSGRRLPPGM
jgi:hypothetical protein